MEPHDELRTHQKKKKKKRWKGPMDSLEIKKKKMQKILQIILFNLYKLK